MLVLGVSARRTLVLASQNRRNHAQNFNAYSRHPCGGYLGRPATCRRDGWCEPQWHRRELPKQLAKTGPQVRPEEKERQEKLGPGFYLPLSCRVLPCSR